MWINNEPQIMSKHDTRYINTILYILYETKQWISRICQNNMLLNLNHILCAFESIGYQVNNELCICLNHIMYICGWEKLTQLKKDVKDWPIYVCMSWSVPRINQRRKGGVQEWDSGFGLQHKIWQFLLTIMTCPKQGCQVNRMMASYDKLWRCLTNVSPQDGKCWQS